MSDGKFLTEKTVKLVSDTIIEKYRVKLPWYMRRFGISRAILNAIFSYLNKAADKVIPDRADSLINRAIQQANAGDWDSATVSIAKAENIIFDISKEMGEEEEYEFFFANMNMIVKNIKRWIRKKGK
jgi:hypothetical protein